MDDQVEPLRQRATGHVGVRAAPRQAAGDDRRVQPATHRSRSGLAKVDDELAESDRAERSLEPSRPGRRRGRRLPGTESQFSVVEGEPDGQILRPVPAPQVGAGGREAHVRRGRVGDTQAGRVGRMRARRPVDDLVAGEASPPSQVARRPGVAEDEGIGRGQAEVLVEVRDLTGLLHDERVCGISRPVRQTLQEPDHLARRPDVRPLVRLLHVPLDVREDIRCRRAQWVEKRAQPGQPPGRLRGDVRCDGVVCGLAGQVVLDADEPHLVAAAGVVRAEPAQDVGDLRGMPLREHLADERAGVSRTAADVAVDPLAGAPVLFPGDTAESPFLDQEPQHPELQLELLGGAVR